MDHVLPKLIDTARAERDRRGVQLRQAQQAAKQTADTLERLKQFRVECLARSAAGTLGRTDAMQLAHYQRFVTRLDEAIAMQDQQRVLRMNQAQAAQEQLTAAQQRLLAFETLVKRRALQRDAKANKLAQREADEFAARAFARNPNHSPTTTA